MQRQTTHLYTLKEGETVKLFEGGAVVCHPDRPPFIVDRFGAQVAIGPLDNWRQVMRICDIDVGPR